MKNILYYLGIIVLLALILFPPALRIFLPDKDSESTSESNVKIIRSLVCSSNEFITNITYSNDDVSNVVVKRIIEKKDESSDVIESES